MGTWDGFETGVRAIVGQQVTVAGAGAMAARIVSRWGTPVEGLAALGLTHLFPTPATLATADLTSVGLTASRAATVRAFAQAVEQGAVWLDRGQSLETLVESLTAIPGLGPWTAHYLALRLSHPDAFPSADAGIRRALATAVGGPVSARDAAERAAAWAPWRAFAAAQLWSTTTEGTAGAASLPAVRDPERGHDELEGAA